MKKKYYNGCLDDNFTFEGQTLQERVEIIREYQKRTYKNEKYHQTDEEIIKGIINFIPEHVDYKMFKTEKLNKNSSLAIENKTFENLDLTTTEEKFKQTAARMEKYCEIFDPYIINTNRSVYLYGEPGTGKSHLVCCIVNKLKEEYNAVVYLTVNDLFKEVKNYWNSTEDKNFVENTLKECDLLILDDIGTEKFLKSDNTEAYIQTLLFDIINYRYEHNKPMFYTSNLSISELQEKGLNPKIVDRIAGTVGKNRNIKLENESYRLLKAQNDKEILF